MKRASIRVQEPTPELIEKIRRARVAISQQKPRYLKCPYPSAKHDQHALLERHLPQGFHCAQGTDGKRRVQETQSPVWLSLGRGT